MLLALFGSLHGIFEVVAGVLLVLFLSVYWSVHQTRFSQKAIVRAAAQGSNLKDRQERLRESIQAMDRSPQALATSSMQRLAQLLEKSEQISQTTSPVEVSQ